MSSYISGMVDSLGPSSIQYHSLKQFRTVVVRHAVHARVKKSIHFGESDVKCTLSRKWVKPLNQVLWPEDCLYSEEELLPSMFAVDRRGKRICTRSQEKERETTEGLKKLSRKANIFVPCQTRQHTVPFFPWKSVTWIPFIAANNHF